MPTIREMTPTSYTWQIICLLVEEKAPLSSSYLLKAVSAQHFNDPAGPAATRSERARWGFRSSLGSDSGQCRRSRPLLQLSAIKRQRDWGRHEPLQVRGFSVRLRVRGSSLRDREGNGWGRGLNNTSETYATILHLHKYEEMFHLKQHVLNRGVSLALAFHDGECKKVTDR